VGEYGQFGMSSAGGPLSVTSGGGNSWTPSCTDQSPRRLATARVSNHQRSSSDSFSLSRGASQGRNRSGSFSSFLSALGSAGNFMGGGNHTNIQPADELVLDQQHREERLLESQLSAEHASPTSAPNVQNLTPQKTPSLHSNITLNSNYRQSISFVKQQFHLYKIFLIGHIQSTDMALTPTLEPSTGALLKGSKERSSMKDPSNLITTTIPGVNTPSKMSPPANPTTSTTTTARVHRKNFTVYLIEVHHHDRSILVSRRYSEFHQLYRYLKQTYPSHQFTIPPKKLVGSMSNQTIEKRKLGLKRFLWEVKQVCAFSEHTQTGRKSVSSHSGASQPPTRNRGVSNNSLPHQPFMWYQDPVIKAFFELEKFDEQPIYQLPNATWKHIFQFLGYNDLYKSVALTSKWLTRILYNQLRSATFSYLNHEVYFQNIPVAIDTNDELYDLILRFAGLQYVNLERFHMIDNSFVERLVRQKGGKLHELNVRNCSIRNTLDLSGSRGNLRRISLAYCKYMDNVILTTSTSIATGAISSHSHSKCNYLNLSGTGITDETLKHIIMHLPELKTLVLRSCAALIAPTIGGKEDSVCCKELQHLDLSHSATLRALMLLNCNKLESLKLDYTSITNHSLQDIVQQCANHLTLLSANACDTITGLSVSSTVMLRMEFAGCKNIDADAWKIDCCNLRVLDFRLTPIQQESQMRQIVDLTQCEWLDKAKYGDEDQFVSSTAIAQDNEPTLKIDKVIMAVESDTKET